VLRSNPQGAMSKLQNTYLKLLLGGLLLLPVSGCAGVGMETLADVLAGGAVRGQDISGEIRQIDTRRREIEVQSGWSGSEWVRYDGRTAVVAGQRRFDVRDLRRGDQVRIVVDDANNRERELYARRIEVQRSANRDQPRHEDVRSGSRLIRLDGNVTRIDERSGSFELNAGRGDIIRVTVANETSREARDRARRLRRGQRVRIEARMTDDDNARLYRFL
jgi:hypothetical protein